ncbi:MAG: M23 family metallopeptidase [Alistipes sp.]
MKLRHITAVLALTALTTPLYSQDINRVQELIQQLQQAVQQVEDNQPEPTPVESIPDTNGIIALDTLASGNDAVKIILFNDNTWRYMRDKEFVKDHEIFTNYWDTTCLLPYRSVSIAALPNSVAIDLVDSLKAYHCPCLHVTRVYSPYGPRHRRAHHGVDLPLKTGDPVYATFNGRVRIAQYNSGGYGNLIVLRHDNGLETYYGHLSERLVTPGQWVEAGQIIGLGGSTGRSSGPHLHFETRYYGQTFDPQRLINFKSGDLLRETILLKKSYFSIHSNAAQDFDDEDVVEKEAANQQVVAKETAAKAAKSNAKSASHKIKSGDTLGSISRRYHTTIDKICKLNKISRSTTLKLGRVLRVK